ncbi:MAG: hypothetical protein JWQ45_2061 [Blastococcus sp.]|nr:hypothetical protein [Blastococcus sp.]
MKVRRPAAGGAGGARALSLFLRAVTGAVILSAGLSACGADDVYLDALRDDPMARWAPTETTDVQRFESSYDEGGGSSKQRLAQVTRLFRLASPEAVLAAQEQGVHHAQARAGWGADSLAREGFLQRPGPGGSTMTLSILASVSDPEELVLEITAP